MLPLVGVSVRGQVCNVLAEVYVGEVVGAEEEGKVSRKGGRVNNVVVSLTHVVSKVVLSVRLYTYIHIYLGIHTTYYYCVQQCATSTLNRGEVTNRTVQFDM